jgi:prepilin-type N-terminal cleavage/methylation domain-containing protein
MALLRRTLRLDAGTKSAARRGFTLVEILMVITIIAILMTLTVGIVGSFLDQARHSATQATLSKIQALMNSRRQAFDRLVQRKGFVTNSPEYQVALSLSQNKNYTILSSAVKPIAIKLLQMKYFPQTAADLNELMSFYGMIGNGSAAQLQLANMYPKLFQSFVNGPTFQVPGTVAGLTNQEILYNFLTENTIGNTPLGTDDFTAVEVVTAPPQSGTQTAGLPYFVDAWKGPIRFYRWPTRLFRSGGWTPGNVQNNTPAQIAPITYPQSNPPQANSNGTYDVTNAQVVFSSLPVFTGQLWNDLARDPDDAFGACAQIKGFLFEDAFHTPATYHMPVIMSAGPDGQFGLGNPDDKIVSTGTTTQTTYGYLATLDPTISTGSIAYDQLSDNIVSASIKAGGK